MKVLFLIAGVIITVIVFAFFHFRKDYLKEPKIEQQKHVKGVFYSNNFEMNNPCFTLFNIEFQPDSIQLLRNLKLLKTFKDVRNLNGIIRFQFKNKIFGYKNYKINLFHKKQIFSIKLQRFEISRLVNGGCGSLSDASFEFDEKS